MRVEAGYRYLRFKDAELQECVAGQPDHGEFPLGLYTLYGFFQRNVGADVYDAQAFRHEHHRVVFSTRKLRQNLSVTGIFIAAEVYSRRGA